MRAGSAEPAKYLPELVKTGGRRHRPHRLRRQGRPQAGRGHALSGQGRPVAAGGDHRRARGQVSRQRVRPHGRPSPADPERPDPGQPLCPGGVGLHDGLRHPGADQLRARRDRHARRHGVGDRARGARRPGGAGATGPARGPGGRGGGLCGHRVPGGARRLPAAAQRPAPGPADHRHRRVHRPAEPGHDHLGPAVPVLPAGAGPPDLRAGRARPSPMSRSSSSGWRR